MKFVKRMKAGHLEHKYLINDKKDKVDKKDKDDKKDIDDKKDKDDKFDKEEKKYMSYMGQFKVRKINTYKFKSILLMND